MADEIYKSQVPHVLRGLWRNWAMAYGAITLPLLLSMLVPRIWLPFICVAEAWALVAWSKSSDAPALDACSLVLRVASKIMLVTALVMFAIVILCTDWLVPTVIHLQLYNSEIPFITALVIFPVTIIMVLVWLFGGLAEGYCRRCQRRNGYYAGDSIIATLYYRETRYQLAILAVVSTAIGAVEYWYYFARYINSNLNAPDRFFFNIIPIAMYALSLLFMAGRYNSMKMLFRTIEDSHSAKVGRTAVRFLIFCGDELLLHPGADNLWDTPVEAIVARTASVGEPQARLIFDGLTGVDNLPMRYCYTNEGFATGSNMVHYAVFADDADRSRFAPDNVWFDPYMLDRALAGNALNPILANELFRIHTMTMAWKTYDRKGRRLYPIRHYRPTFRLRDLREWKVDYDDQKWFDVAHNNEDRPFYHLRNFWERLTGVFSHKTHQADE